MTTWPSYDSGVFEMRGTDPARHSNSSIGSHARLFADR